MTSKHEEIAEWAEMFMPTKADQMAELYAKDGLSFSEISIAFDTNPRTVGRMISSYLPSKKEVDKFKREFVRKVIDGRPKRH